MKTVCVVATAKGWYVTRRYGNLNKGMQFFAFGPTKKSKKAAEAQKDAYVKEWMGE